MKERIIIKNGSCEYPCWQNDDGTCSYACPQLCDKDGFTYGECLALNMHHDIKDFKCSVGEKVRVPIVS